MKQGWKSEQWHEELVTDNRVTDVSQGHEDLACALKEIRQYRPMQEPLGDPWRRKGVLILASK